MSDNPAYWFVCHFKCDIGQDYRARRKADVIENRAAPERDSSVENWKTQSRTTSFALSGCNLQGTECGRFYIQLSLLHPCDDCRAGST